METFLANTLFSGNALLAAEAAIGLLCAAAVHTTWDHKIMALYPKHHLGHITGAYIMMTMIVLIVTTFGASICWKLRNKDIKYQEGERGCTSYIGMALAVIFGLFMLAYAFTCELKKVREGTGDDIAYAMYQHYLNPSSTLDNLHKDFRCCGINGYTDWTQLGNSPDPKSTTRVSVPRSCCIVASSDGTCFKFQDQGCRAALLDYFNMWVPSLIFCTAFVAISLILLVATSWKLRKALMSREEILRRTDES